jgi:ferritin-like metal-binding protein YciE
MDQQTLHKFFVEQLKDLYDAEQQLVKALPKLAEAASSEKLKEALTSHLEETRTHVTRLEEVFSLASETATRKKCKAMQGLLAEGDEASKEEKEGELRDLAIIAGGQRVEHYEISAYGTAKALAERLGLDNAVELLYQTEEEESAADESLTEVAEEIYDTIDEDEEVEDQEAGDVAETAAPARKIPVKAAGNAGTSRKRAVK